MCFIMASKYSVKLKTIAEEHDLIVVNKSSDYETAVITTADLNRPAMQLTGFYNYFDPKRLQIIGRVESTYLDTLRTEERFQAWETFMQYDIAGLVICHGVPALPECLAMAQRYNRNVFITEQDTSQFQAELIGTLQRYLAPRITMHGVLVEVYGEGCLLLGDSGVGKSETAIELIKRGHRLIADDAVEIKKMSAKTLVGKAPELIRYFIELRGIGIVDMIRCMAEDKPHKASAEMAKHVTDTILCVDEAAEQGRVVKVQSTAVKPEGLWLMPETILWK